MRVELIKIGERKHLLFFDIHHIIADGTSVEIITRDFNDLYFGKEHAVRLQYKDYAVWQQHSRFTGIQFTSKVLAGPFLALHYLCWSFHLTMSVHHSDPCKGDVFISR